MGKNRKQASLTNVVQYDSNFNLSIGTSTSSSFNSSGSIIAASGFTGSLSGSVFGLGNTVSFSSSVSSDLINLESKSASVDISISSINTFTASNANQSLNQLTGSLARTGSNTFYGTQVFSGSVFIATDLIVQGSSSIQYISASSVSIGTNIVQLNTATPSVRYAGISVQDSGSSAGVTGSMLWDSLCNRWIYSNPSTIGYSGGMLMSGPRTSTLGTELPLTCNYIAKSGGGDHLYDSCIWEMSGSVGINCATPSYNLDVNGCGRFSGAVTAAGAIFTSATETRGNIRTTFTSDNSYYSLFSNDGALTLDTYGTGGYMNFKILGSTKLSIASTGVTCFSNTVCVPGIVSSGNLQINGTSCGKLVGFSNYSNNNVGLSLYNQAGTEVIYLNGNSGGIGSTSMISTYFSGTCLTLNGFSSGNGFKMNYGNASGEITAINLIANGTTNGFIGIQMVDGSNGDLWLGSSANRSMTIYRTGNHGFNVNAPCTRVHVDGGYGARFGCGYCFYGGGYAGGGFPYGDEFGNGAAYTYQTANTTATNGSLFGGYAAGYFKGGGGSAYGGGGAGVVAIGGNGANAESVNSGGGAGIFARGGLNGAATALSYAGWFDGGDVMVRCGSVLSCAKNNGYNFRALGFATGTIASGGSCLIFSNLDRGLYLISIASSVTSTFGYSAFLWVDSGNITVSSVIRQSCVAISTSGRYLCVVNQYTAEAASMTITTLNLLNYIG